MKLIGKTKALQIYECNGKHTYIVINFTYGNYEYLISLTTIPTQWVRWEKHRGKYVLRLHLKAKHKRKLINTAGCVRVGKTSEMYDRNSEYNNGDQIEAFLYTAMTGKTWHKDYTPWYEGADIEISDTVRIQVKRENATITNLNRLMTFVS